MSLDEKIDNDFRVKGGRRLAETHDGLRGGYKSERAIGGSASMSLAACT